jgi:hypothetical protein
MDEGPSATTGEIQALRCNDQTYQRNQMHIKTANIDPVQTTVNDQSEGQLRKANETPQKTTRSHSPTPEATRAWNSSL